MSLPNYLAKIKSSGIYRFVWDKSEIPGQQAETLRLVVGYSEKGPFNTPVYVEKADDFRAIYGGISKKLERYGVWFHRMALQALKKGPILALNLKPFNNEKVQGISFDPQDSIGNEIEVAVKNLYNTNRFWTLEPEHFEDIEDLQGYISVLATDSREASNTIFIRGYQPTGYDVTFKEWYSSVLNGEDIPSYLEGHENDYLSQYWAEIYVFKGQFTPAIATSDKLAKFFNVNGQDVTLKPYITNAFGEKLDTLEQLAANSASNFIKSYSGILLPDFMSASNTVISLDAQFNSDNFLHKMMMRLNQSMLYSIDPDDTDPNAFSMSSIDTTGWSKGPVASISMMSFSGLTPVVFTATFNDGEWSYDEGTHTGENANYYKYEDLNAIKDGEYDLLFTDTDNRFGNTGIVEGDTLWLESETTHVVKIDQELNGYTFDSYDGDPDNGGTLQASGTVKILSEDPDTHDVTVKVISNSVSGWEGMEFTATPATPSGSTTGNWYEITEGPSGQGVGMWIEVQDNFNTYTVTVDKDITSLSDLTIYKCISSVTYTSANLVPTYLEGYTYENAKPAGTSQSDKLNWQHAILDVLSDYKGIRTALTGRVDVDYRYIVDTFESFVETECKSRLTVIAKEKDNAFVFANFPAMTSFSKCTYTSFTNNDGLFDTKYIAEGGNHQKSIGRLFTLASEENGGSYVSYNTCLNIRDTSTGIKYTCPAAALVSNLFMDKYTKYFPYTIIAGPNRAVISENGLIGPDFNFSREDLDNLEPFGVNCMVYVPGTGTYINSNQTAKQNPVTALSKIHVRELCIFLQDEIEALLRSYQWDFNTPNLRSTIKDRADVILETCKCNGGVFEYINVCDETNNTEDVINNEMFVLSTSIEPGMGAGKMVQELTIYRRGGMSSLIK